jgi:hypothetical protein
MSKELEQTIKELIDAKDLKRNADRVQYHISKEYEQTYDSAFAMVKAGHKMAEKSKYYAEIETVERGSVNNAYIVNKLEERYPKLASVIEQYRKECREESVEKLNYGRK